MTHPQTIALDLIDVDAAWRAGISSFRAGFPQHANPWEGCVPEFGERLRDVKLKAWAFDFGWRESMWLGEARRKAVGA